MKRVKVRHGKAQSAVRLVVGNIFVLIGLVIIMPMFSYFGISWTVLAAVMSLYRQ